MADNNGALQYCNLLSAVLHDQSNWTPPNTKQMPSNTKWVDLWATCPITKKGGKNPHIEDYMRKGLIRSLPQSLWPLGWWGRRSLVPRRCTPPRVHAPAVQPCTLWWPRPTHALSGRWNSWQSVCRPGWAAPYGPTPCGPWRSSHSSWQANDNKGVIRLSEQMWFMKNNIILKQTNKKIKTNKQNTGFEDCLKVSLNFAYPVATSHIFMVLSLEAETMWSPLGIMATDETLWSWPEKQKRQK